MLDKEEVAGIAEYECDRGNAEEATHSRPNMCLDSNPKHMLVFGISSTDTCIYPIWVGEALHTQLISATTCSLMPHY